MNFFHQFYFILYRYFYNRAKYMNTAIKYSAEGNASRVIGLPFIGWVVFFYFFIIRIFDFTDVDITFGKFIVVITSIIIYGLINNYFDKNARYLAIYKEYIGKDVKKSKVIFLAVMFFVLPYFLLIFLFLVGWL